MGVLSLTEDNFKLTVSEIYTVWIYQCNPGDRDWLTERLGQLELTNIQQIRKQMIELWMERYAHARNITIVETHYSYQGFTSAFVDLNLYEMSGRRIVGARFILKVDATLTERDMHEEFISAYDAGHRFLLYNRNEKKYEDFYSF